LRAVERWLLAINARHSPIKFVYGRMADHPDGIVPSTSISSQYIHQEMLAGGGGLAAQVAVRQSAPMIGK
jgi:hypothetical protein